MSAPSKSRKSKKRKKGKLGRPPFNARQIAAIHKMSAQQQRSDAAERFIRAGDSVFNDIDPYFAQKEQVLRELHDMDKCMECADWQFDGVGICECPCHEEDDA